MDQHFTPNTWHETTEMFGVNGKPHKCKGEITYQVTEEIPWICLRLAKLSVQNLSIFSLKIKVNG